MPKMASRRVRSGVRSRLTPLAKAPEQSLRCIARTAPRLATRAEEHAVSKEMLGPCSPITYEIRPDAIENVNPVCANSDSPAGMMRKTSAHSVAPIPTNTPVRLPASVSFACLVLRRLASIRQELVKAIQNRCQV